MNSDCCMRALQTLSISVENIYDLSECNKSIPSLEFFSSEYSALQKTTSAASSTTSLREYSIFPHQPFTTTVAADFALKSIVDAANEGVSQLHHQNDINPIYRSQVYNGIDNCLLDTLPATETILTSDDEYVSVDTKHMTRF